MITWQVEAGGLKACYIREAERFGRCREATGTRDRKG